MLFVDGMPETYVPGFPWLVLNGGLNDIFGTDGDLTLLDNITVWMDSILRQAIADGSKVALVTYPIGVDFSSGPVGAAYNELVARFEALAVATAGVHFVPGHRLFGPYPADAEMFAEDMSHLSPLGQEVLGAAISGVISEAGGLRSVSNPVGRVTSDVRSLRPGRFVRVCVDHDGDGPDSYIDAGEIFLSPIADVSGVLAPGRVITIECPSGSQYVPTLANPTCAETVPLLAADMAGTWRLNATLLSGRYEVCVDFGSGPGPSGFRVLVHSILSAGTANVVAGGLLACEGACENGRVAFGGPHGCAGADAGELQAAGTVATALARERAASIVEPGSLFTGYSEVDASILAAAGAGLAYAPVSAPPSAYAAVCLAYGNDILVDSLVRVFVSGVYAVSPQVLRKDGSLEIHCVGCVRMTAFLSTSCSQLMPAGRLRCGLGAEASKCHFDFSVTGLHVGEIRLCLVAGGKAMDAGYRLLVSAIEAAVPVVASSPPVLLPYGDLEDLRVVCAGESLSELQALFVAYDTNADGNLTTTEWGSLTDSVAATDVLRKYFHGDVYFVQLDADGSGLMVVPELLGASGLGAVVSDRDDCALHIVPNGEFCNSTDVLQVEWIGGRALVNTSHYPVGFYELCSGPVSSGLRVLFSGVERNKAVSLILARQYQRNVLPGLQRRFGICGARLSSDPSNVAGDCERNPSFSDEERQ
jgi:hypothetical protein